MCPNQFMESPLLPDCHISNHVFMYSLLQSLQTEETRIEEVDVQLRDRYEVFRQLLRNYPMPLYQHSEEHFQPDLDLALGSTALGSNGTENQDNSVSSSNSMDTDMDTESRSLSSASASFNEEPLSARCASYEETVSHELGADQSF